LDGKLKSLETKVSLKWSNFITIGNFHLIIKFFLKRRVKLCGMTVYGIDKIKLI